MLQEVKRIAAENNAKMVEFARQLVRTPSMSCQEAEVAKLVATEMKALGYDEVFTDAWGNVVGIVKGTEPGPAILYNGHMDVVPVGEPADWAPYTPFGGDLDEALMMDQDHTKEETVQVIHGRGASDLKGCAAGMIYGGKILLELKKKGYAIKGDYVVSMVVMEENGDMQGTVKLMDETLPEKGIEVDGLICCEPSSLKLMLGHRGRMEILVTVYGQSCHGSSPWMGKNAVVKAAKFITEADKLSWPGRDDPDLGGPSIALTIVNCEPGGVCIVPDKCNLLYDRRLAPGETPEGAVAEMQAIADRLAAEDPDFRAEVRINAVERVSYTGVSELVENCKTFWKTSKEHPFVKACCAGLKDAGQTPKMDYWHFGTDVPAVAATHNKPSVGYSGGQEYTIHTPYEKIRVDYMEQALVGNVTMFLRLVELPKEVFANDYK